ncbi:MAG: low temperature requirement protein A [Longimicrobiales bacterium]
MSTTSIVSPEEQNVTFVELFFDLVFVFCVTQIVGLLHDGFTASAIGQAVLVFWLVWWGWTQFTWALNAADTTHHVVELATLFATAVAFFMAVAIPDAFHGRVAWFAVPYVAVRVTGLTVYGWVAAAADATQHAAVRKFSLVSVGEWRPSSPAASSAVRRSTFSGASRSFSTSSPRLSAASSRAGTCTPLTSSNVTRSS